MTVAVHKGSMTAKFVSTVEGRPTRPLFARATLLGAIGFVTSLAGCSGAVSGPLGSFDGDGAGTGAPGASGVDGTNDNNKANPNTGVSTAPLDCKSGVHVGYTPLQRISREQYKNSLRDLLKVDFDIELLSEDERVGVFDGNVVAPITELLVDEYASAAERAASQAKANLESLVSCDRASQGDDKCAAQFVEKFGQRAYRRPLSVEEKAAYADLYGAYKGAGYPDALRVIVQTMLQSPNFLYRVELQPLTPGSADNAALDAYELASRLSFFLLSTTPDDTLLAAAASGELMTPDGLEQQTTRLIEDARFSDTLASFHTHWLELKKLASITKDEALFPNFSGDVADLMLKDTLSFVNHVIRDDDARLDTLLTASYGFPEGDLAKVYGVSASSDGKPVTLDPAQRAGLLTQPAFLAAHAHYNQTSPVERGKIVIRNVLCQALPDPPPNVNTTPPDPSSTATVRQRLLEHQESPSCVGCHKRIDGIGLGFEQFDAIGTFRSMEANQPVDSSGEIVSAGDATGKFSNTVELAQKLAGSAEVQECVATQWLRFALGRMEESADACTLDKLFKDFAASDSDIRVLLQAIVESDAFRTKRVSNEVTP
jgi:Protein of unknown function (DUF1592)/Protein of unknown function (DUF1588)/Protein of unknown function (DUF1595)/Protein of unknown function (DUF1585)/Protein of unknown function (DUF1587)